MYEEIMINCYILQMIFHFSYIGFISFFIIMRTVVFNLPLLVVKKRSSNKSEGHV